MGPVTIDDLRVATALSGRVMRGVHVDQMQAPTPCTAWDVRALMTHNVHSTEFFADAATYGALPTDKVWPEYADDELVSAYDRLAERAIRAFSAPGVMERPMHILAGPDDPWFCLMIATHERLVHGWDLAAATGQAITEDVEDLARRLLANDTYRSVNEQSRPSAIGPAVEVSADASAFARLLGLLGRDPDWSYGIR